MADSLFPQIELLRAVGFAAEKHRYQIRKGKDRSPYINHPIAVAETLATTGGLSDLGALQAAVLHDAIEDTQTTPEELEEVFGAEVRDLVVEVTDHKELPNVRIKSPKGTNYGHFFSHLPGCPLPTVDDDDARLCRTHSRRTPATLRGRRLSWIVVAGGTLR